MARKNILDLAPEENKEKAKSLQDQIDLVDTIFPDGVKPAEIGQQALKLLLAEAQGFIKLDPEAKKFWIKSADKYTPDAPKAIEVTKKQSPEEYLEEAFETYDVLLEEADERAESFGEQADKRSIEINAYEQTLLSDEEMANRLIQDKELDNAFIERTIITES